MIDSVIGLDVRRDDERAVPGARMGRGGGMGCVWGGEPAPGQREVGRRGGAFWLRCRTEGEAAGQRG